MALTLHRLMSVSGLLLIGMLLLLAEGCLSTRSQPLYYQETALPQEQISALILRSVQMDLLEHPQSREAHLLQNFYNSRGGRPGWIESQGISLSAWQLIDMLEAAEGEGLPVQRYEPESLRRRLQPSVDKTKPYLGWPPHQIAQVDMALSRAFFRYAGDNLYGQERSWLSRGDWHRKPREVNAPHLLNLALELNAMPSALRGLPPDKKGYRQLRQMLKFYRELAALGGWPVIDSGEVLHPGQSDRRVLQLHHRLRLEGDLGVAVPASEQFVPEIRQALMVFQERHGLVPDGTLGPQTLIALNTPVEFRIDQILRNMERWRWDSARAAETEIRINLPAYSLAVAQGEEILLEMPVVIGRAKRPTPLFTSQLESLIYSPYWYVPPTLLREVLPRIVEDSGYLRRNHYEVLDEGGDVIKFGRSFGRQWQQGDLEAALRQKPGPWNPMGRIKFMMPNPWSIYLHDTPQKTLFSRTRRAFSSGCIRLSQPEKLAQWLLAYCNSEQESFDLRLDSGRSRMVALEKSVDLRIGYWTAWVDEAGRINFRDDIYGRDIRLARELRQASPLLALSSSESNAQF